MSRPRHPPYFPGPYAPCPCGADRKARFCCRTGDCWWQRAPVSLQELPPGSSLSGCYAAHLGTCGGKLSLEHFISEGILREFGPLVDVSGFHWVPPGESKLVPPQTLAARVLCQTHNSVLSPLDNRALVLARTALDITRTIGDPASPTTFDLFAGEDLERFMLKAFIGVVTSRVLLGRREVPKDQPGIQQLVRILFGLEPMLPEMGLYVPFKENAMLPLEQRITVRIVSFDDNPDNIAGLELRFFGLHLAFFLERPIPGKGGYFEPVYHPEYVLMENDAGAIRHLHFSWQGEKHRPGVEYGRGRWVDVPAAK